MLLLEYEIDWSHRSSIIASNLKWAWLHTIEALLELNHKQGYHWKILRKTGPISKNNQREVKSWIAKQ